MFKELTLSVLLLSSSGLIAVEEHNPAVEQVTENDWKGTKKLLEDLTENNSKVMMNFLSFAAEVEQARRSGEISTTNVDQILKAIAFSAEKHRFQKRKDLERTPYISHPIGVAEQLIKIGRVHNADIIIAALLHDTAEDTETSFEEIRDQFGPIVEGIVREVTDDKSLPKAERKRLQIINAPHKSTAATLVKLSDKLYNLSDLLRNPPEDWDRQRVNDYFNWAKQVVNALPRVNPALEKAVQIVIAEYRLSQTS